MPDEEMPEWRKKVQARIATKEAEDKTISTPTAQGSTSQPWENQGFDSAIPEVYDGQAAVKAAYRELDELTSNISMLELYRTLYPGNKVIMNPRHKDLAQVVCPQHDDTKPSANIRADDKVMNCFPCSGGTEGWNVWRVASFAWGLENHADLPEVKKKLLEQFCGMTWDTLLNRHRVAAAARLATAPVTPANPTQPVTGEAPPSPEVSIPSLQAQEDEQALRRERARRKAIRVLDQEELRDSWKPPVLGFAPSKASDFLDEPDDDEEWTFKDLCPRGGNTLIIGAAKTRKSRTALNLAHSLLTGEPFMGRFEAPEKYGKIAYINLELLPNGFRAYMRKIDGGRGLKDDRLRIHNARGEGLSIMNDAVFKWMLAELKREDYECMIVDPYFDFYAGDYNSNTDVAEFTRRVDRLKKESGVKDVFIVVHTGNDDTRPLGASRLVGWGDTNILLRREEGKSGTPDRFFFKVTKGRCPDFAETEYFEKGADNWLQTFDRPGGSLPIKDQVYLHLVTNGPCSGAAVERGVPGKAASIRQAIKDLESAGKILNLAGKWEVAP